VRSYLANKRQGTSKAKERSEVSGGGKKLSSKKAQVMQDAVQAGLLSWLAAVRFSDQDLTGIF